MALARWHEFLADFAARADADFAVAQVCGQLESLDWERMDSASFRDAAQVFRVFGWWAAVPSAQRRAWVTARVFVIACLNMPSISGIARPGRETLFEKFQGWVQDYVSEDEPSLDDVHRALFNYFYPYYPALDGPDLQG